jgi:glycerol kinase
MKYILSLDQGTTSSRALLIDHSGEIRGVRQKEFPQIFPQSGWVEHDPMDILNSQLDVAKEVVSEICEPTDEIVGLGITNQRETIIVWNKHTGKPVHNAIVWQCARSSDYCKTLRNDGYAETIHEKTGLVVDSYFSGPKIKWILDNVDGVRVAAENGDLIAGTVDCWLVWNLTGGECHVTDYSNASRTMLFNIKTLRWDEELLDLMKIPLSMLPEVKPSSHVYGNVKKSIFAKNIPICGILGDQQAALFGNLCLNQGTMKTTYGTGAFMLMNTGEEPVFSKNGLLTTIACGIDDKVVYALEGSVFMAGATIQWLRDSLGIISNASETEALAESVDDSYGVYFVPAFQGLGTPYWNMDAKAAIFGLTRGAKREHIVRAALEAIAYRVHDVLSTMRRDSGMALTEMRVDGGAAMNNFLMRFQADISAATIIRPDNIESTAMGAAFAAGLAVGFWNNTEELAAINDQHRIFEPRMNDEKRDQLYSGWQDAVRRCIE